jgi:glycosyltransferase involved in cell wall biosynthesis
LSVSTLAKNFAAYLPALSRQHAAARAVVAVSGDNLELLHRHFGTPKHQGMVIHNGRPPRFFQPVDASVRQRLRSELQIPDRTVVCFTAARLTKIKGFAYQLEAIKRLQKKGALKDLCFVWAGDGDQRAALTQAVADLGLGDHVRFLGHRWDIADWYDAADIFILSSELEGMPLSIMEAMAKGVPVIATAVSGTPEELGATGKLLPNPLKDPEGVIHELAETIERWAAHPELRQQIGAQGNERARLLFREELMTQRMIELAVANVSTR